MLLFPAAVTGGLALGLLRGGSLSGLAELRLRALGLLGAVVAAQLLLGAVPRWAHPLALGFVYVGIGVWLGLQRGRGAHRLGLLLLAGGWALNVAVMAANGGMPVAEDARASVGAGGRDVAVGNLWKHVHAEEATRLASLGDVIPITVPGFRAVVSVGDLLLLSGVGFLVAGAMSLTSRDAPEDMGAGWGDAWRSPPPTCVAAGRDESRRTSSRDASPGRGACGVAFRLPADRRPAKPPGRGPRGPRGVRARA